MTVSTKHLDSESARQTTAAESQHDTQHLGFFINKQLKRMFNSYVFGFKCFNEFITIKIV